MSTDSSELAFVRCPSCRSLVPAVSTRCRMCGATLDPSQKVEETQHEPSKSGRVRQRTTATSSSELSATAGMIRQEMGASTSEPPPPAPAATEAPAAAQASEAPNDDDPLSAYIQEVDTESTSPDSNGGALTRSDESASTKSGAEDAAQANKPKVIVESGPRRGNKPSGLSFGGGKNREETPRSERDTSSEGGWKPVGAREGGNKEAANRPQSGGAQGGREARFDRRPDASNRPGREGRDDRGNRAAQGRGDPARAEPGRGEVPTRPEPTRADNVPLSQAQTGKLVGWFVSYVDPRGKGVELREGRFFITSNSLKPHDMVLDDASISTPHAMVAVGLQEGLRVQDLMSDRGIFVKRRSQEGYQRISDAVKLENGDWVRFGEVEFMVCLLPGGSAK